MNNETRARLAKLLRMLTSDHEGEVLNAAAKVVGIVNAHDIDWDEALGGRGDGLSRGDMQRIYDEGYRRGAADAAVSASSSPRDDDWAKAGTARSDEIGDHLEGIRHLLTLAADAEGAGKLSPFEKEFCDNMRGRFASWGRRTFVSEKQRDVLARLAAKLERMGSK